MLVFGRVVAIILCAGFVIIPLTIGEVIVPRWPAIRERVVALFSRRKHPEIKVLTDREREK